VIQRRKSAKALYEDFGRAVRKLREERGLTQGTLADMLIMNRSALNQLERGKHLRVPLHLLYALAQALNVQPYELMPSLPFQTPGQGTVAVPLLPADANEDERHWVNDVLSFPHQILVNDPRGETNYYRHEVNNPPIPIDYIAAENGYQVIYIPYPGKEKLVGFCHEDGEQRRLGINSLLPRVRQRFAIAYFINRKQGDKPAFVREFPFLSIAKNGFTPEWADDAMELLMPLNNLKDDLYGEILNFDDGEFINRLALRYQVSPSLMTLQLAKHFCYRKEKTK
jgi:transcriptional regulator with XRE-family HTH domain